MSALSKAKKWWSENVVNQPVWRIEDLPVKEYKEILLMLDLAHSIRRDILVLGKPNTDTLTLMNSYFWEIISCILKPYSYYAITDITALQFYLGECSIPEKVHVITKSSSIQINLQGISTLALEKKPQLFEGTSATILFKEVQIKKNYLLNFESPESLLLGLRAQQFRDFPQLISSFIKTIEFNKEALSELLLQKSKPITYQRLAGLFEQINKKQEADLIRMSLKATLDYASPGKMQILKYALPPSIVFPKQLSDSQAVTRFRDQLRVYRDHVDFSLKDLLLPKWTFEQVQTYAEHTKKYDTYHSSTIEGYRVTTEEIQALIEGRNFLTDKTHEEIEKKMALKGYLEAHKFVLRKIEEHFVTKKPLTELTIREIYAQLFSPSVEAGILSKEQLIRYRNDAVYIRHSRYVPPNYLKVDDLMRCLVEELNEIENFATQSIVAHYGFVTVHPYFDGNGRVSRLLMNYLLGRSGVPWITIRLEDRERYFKALEIAQCDENCEFFTELMKKYFVESLSFRQE